MRTTCLPTIDALVATRCQYQKEGPVHITCLEGDPLHTVDRDTSENISFLQLRWRSVTITLEFTDSRCEAFVLKYQVQGIV